MWLFRQKAVNWGFVLVRQFDTSEGPLFSTVDVPQMREMGRGVDDMHCCLTHLWGVLNQERVDHNSKFITLSANVKISNWKADEIREMLLSPQ